jgi:tetratricopeptide (TPR) repeat protein
MEKYIELLKKYNLSFAKEAFYVLLNCIDNNIDTYDELVVAFEDRDDYEELKSDYQKFYYFMKDYFNSMDINKDMMLHYKVIELVDIILDNNPEELQADLKMFISNVIDMVFFKYGLNISIYNSNEEIKKYLLEKIKDERIVNLLVLLLLADTSLSEKNIDSIPEEEFENIISSIILISIYICKSEEKNSGKDSKTDSRG